MKYICRITQIIKLVFSMLSIVLYLLSFCIIILLTMMGIILLLNILIRPKLWTAFNIVILIYFLLTTILGSVNIFNITSIVSQNMDTFEVESQMDIPQMVAIQFERWTQLKEDCTIHILYSGTWLLREGILTGMIFTRQKI